MEPASGTCLTCERWQRGCTANTDGAEAWASVWASPADGLARVYDDAPPCPSHWPTRRRTPFGEVPLAQRIGALRPRGTRTR
jgi:hypothetical protein